MSGIDCSANSANAGVGNNGARQTEASESPLEFGEKEIDDLVVPFSATTGFLGVDILLTAQWPADVAKYSSNQPTETVQGSALLSRLAAGYHFFSLSQIAN